MTIVTAVVTVFIVTSSFLLFSFFFIVITFIITVVTICIIATFLLIPIPRATSCQVLHCHCLMEPTSDAGTVLFPYEKLGSRDSEREVPQGPQQSLGEARWSTMGNTLGGY